MNTKKIRNFAFQSDRYISLAVALILISVVCYFESTKSELRVFDGAPVTVRGTFAWTF